MSDLSKLNDKQSLLLTQLSYYIIVTKPSPSSFIVISEPKTPPSTQYI